MSVTVVRQETTVRPLSSGAIQVNVVAGQGPSGPGLPAGGTAGQVARKRSGADYDTEWASLAGGLSPEVVSATFAFGDAAHAYYAAPAACRVVGAAITYRVAFNGTTPVVLVGVSNGDGSILAAGDSDPAAAGTYGATTDVALAGGAGVWITISPGGSTAGGGVLTLFLSFT